MKNRLRDDLHAINKKQKNFLNVQTRHKTIITLQQIFEENNAFRYKYFLVDFLFRKNHF